MRWRQFSRSSLTQLQLGCDLLPSLPAPLAVRSHNSTHQSCTSLPTQLLLPISDKAPFFFTSVVERPSWNFSLLSSQSYLWSFHSHRLRKHTGDSWNAYPTSKHLLNQGDRSCWEYQALLNRWPWSVIHLQGLVEIKDLWGAWENVASPTSPSAGAANPAPVAPFSDGTTEREKSPRRMMATSFYSPMLWDKWWKSLTPLGLKTVNVDGVDLKDDLPSLGRGNTSDTGEFHIEDCCPLSSCLKRIQLACPTLFSRASSFVTCCLRSQHLQEVRFFHEQHVLNLDSCVL